MAPTPQTSHSVTVGNAATPPEFHFQRTPTEPSKPPSFNASAAAVELASVLECDSMQAEEALAASGTLYIHIYLFIYI